MVPILKKWAIAGLIAFYVGLAGGLTLEINDSSTWRLPDEIWVNDGGVWRAIEQVSHNDGGTWRTSYQASIIDVTIGSLGSFYGYSHVNTGQNLTGDGLSTPFIEVPGVGGILAVVDDNTNNFLSLWLCTSVSQPQTAFSRLILYDTAGTSYVEYTTTVVDSYGENSDSNQCSITPPSEGGGPIIHQWRWDTTADHWTAADVGGSRKILIVR